jgi:hypothetical protein
MIRAWGTTIMTTSTTSLRKRFCAVLAVLAFAGCVGQDGAGLGVEEYELSGDEAGRREVMTDPAGLTREKWNQWEKATGDKLQEMDDLISAGVLDILRQVFAISDGGNQNGVISGFVCSPEAGTLNVKVTGGVALALATAAYDPTDYTSSMMALLLGRSDLTGYFGSVAVDAGDAADRYDLVYLLPGEVDAETKAVDIYSGGTGPFVSQNKQTQRRNTPTIHVSKGVPGAGVPTVPPAGSTWLCRILVPAGAVNLDTATFTDARILLGRQAKVAKLEPWAAGSFDVGLGAAVLGEGPFNVASVTRIAEGKFSVSLIAGLPKGLFEGWNAQVNGFRVVGIANGFLVSSIQINGAGTAATIYCWDETGSLVDPTRIYFEIKVSRT